MLPSAQVLKTYKTDRPVNSADISPIFDHILIGGGQEASQVCRCNATLAAHWRSGQLLPHLNHTSTMS